MNKAVIVMEMPENCRDCQYFGSKCRLTGTSPRFYNEDGRANNCPLRELPKKIKSNDLMEAAMKNDSFDGFDDEMAYFEGRKVGWNDCIDAIEGSGVK